jgi:hypothetical protein
VLTEDGEVEIAVPRDRAGSFEPQLIAKGQTRFDGFDDKILSLRLAQIRGGRYFSRSYKNSCARCAMTAETTAKAFSGTLMLASEARPRPPAFGACSTRTGRRRNPYRFGASARPTTKTGAFGGDRSSGNLVRKAYLLLSR